LGWTGRGGSKGTDQTISEVEARLPGKERKNELGTAYEAKAVRNLSGRRG